MERWRIGEYYLRKSHTIYEAELTHHVILALGTRLLLLPNNVPPLRNTALSIHLSKSVGTAAHVAQAEATLTRLGMDTVADEPRAASVSVVTLCRQGVNVHSISNTSLYLHFLWNEPN